MSMIVYGASAVGNTTNSRRMMRHLGCTSIVDDAGDCYPKTKAEVVAFKQNNVLYVTSTAPAIDDLENSRRVLKYEDVMAQIQR